MGSEVGDCPIDIFKKLGQQVGGHRREGESQKSFQHDGAGAVILKQMDADGFGIDALGFHAHEVAAVERHRIKCVLVFRVFLQRLLDNVVAFFENGIFLFFFLDVFRAFIGFQKDFLGNARSVGNVPADSAGGFAFECFQLFGGGSLEAKGDEADAETPDVIFLGGTVEFDGENVLVGVHQFGEEGFPGDSFGINQSEVGVVQEGDNLVAFFGGADKDFGDFLCFFFGGGVAGRVVRKVQKENFLADAVFGESRFQSVNVESAVFEGVECIDLRTVAVFNSEFVIVPIKVGNDDFVAGIQKEIAGNGNRMGQRGRNDGAGESFRGQSRILADDLFFPGVAEFLVAIAGRL